MNGVKLHFGRLMLSMALFAGITALPIWAWGQATATAPATTAAAPGKFVPAPRAIEHYDSACLWCHGPEGSSYGPEFGKGLTDAQLSKVIDDMARGPGGQPLDEAGLAAQTAFHRAIIDGIPYLSATGLKDGVLTGEVSTDAVVTIAAGGKTLQATVDGSSWKVTLPPNTDPTALTIIADRKGKKTQLSLTKPPAHSHATTATSPATAPGK